MRGVTAFSDERAGLVRRRYPTGEDVEQILADLNALPGDSISRKQLQHWAARQKVDRPKAIFFPPERQEIVRRRWPAGDSSPAILAEINALPGLTVSEKQLRNWADDHGLKRPAGPVRPHPVFCAERQAIIRRTYAQGQELDAILAEINAIPGPVATAQQIREWANHRGLRRPDSQRTLGPKFTPEREAIARPRYGESADSVNDIVIALNELPGPPITAAQLRKWAQHRGIKRPAEAKSVASARLWHARSDVSQTPFVYTPKAEKPKPSGLKAVDLRTIYQWGATLGLPLAQRGDVEAVSRAYRKYEDPTHPGFSIRAIPGRLRFGTERQ